MLEAIEWAEDKCVNIYTDLAFAYHVIHRDLGSWLRNDWKTAGGGLPKHEDILKEILLRLPRPEKLAIFKMAAHTNCDATEARGNAAADEAAKTTAGLYWNKQGSLMLAVRPVEKDLKEEERPKSLTAWAHAQADSTQKEQDLWLTKGACIRNIMIDGFDQEVGLWRGPKGGLVLPERYLPMLAL